MIHVQAAGSAQELGRSRGEALAELLPDALALLLPNDRFDHNALTDVRSVLERSLPDVLDEAEGLAEGAGIDADRALAMSVSADLTGRLPAYCSLLAVDGETGPLVVKNLDSDPAMGPLQVVETLARTGSREFVHLTTAGAAWTDGGVNQSGLALVNASLAAARRNPDGLPDGIVARELLAACDDVEDAIAFLESHDVRTFGENVLLADSAGAVAVVEKLPHGTAVRRGATGVACNHVLTPRLEREMDSDDPVAANSRRRLERLEAIGESSVRDGEQLLELFGDPHAGIRQSGDANLWTVASLLLEPASRHLSVAAGDVTASFKARKGADVHT